MSLLPNQILPQTIPFGTVVGSQVLIDQNWWLLLYNLCAQVLGGQASLPPQAATVITLGASPFTYTAPSSGLLAVTGGKVSALSLTRGAVVVTVGISVELFPVVGGDVVQVTYSIVPKMTFLPFSVVSS